MGYITTIYSKLSHKQKKKLLTFLQENFISDTQSSLGNEATNFESRMQLFSGTQNNKNFEFEDSTIIILDIDSDNNDIKGCICLLYNDLLIKKLNNNNISLDYYIFLQNEHGCFIYNLCVNKNLRNQNIATNLIKFTIDKMKELNIIYLHAHAENEISKNVFLKNNFEVKDKYENVYVISKYI